MREKQKANLYVCKKMRLLNFLINAGFQIKRTSVDRNNPKYNVWLFENTKELRDKVEEYYNLPREERNV